MKGESGMKSGTVGTVVRYDDYVVFMPDKITGEEAYETNDCDGFFVEESNLELIEEQYQPITPKAGQKYRVLKDLLKFSSLETVKESKAGTEIIFKGFKDGGRSFSIGKTWLYNSEKCLTTEFLELIEDVQGEVLKNGHTGKVTYVTLEPINKTNKQTIMQKLTSALKRALDGDKQTLYKAGCIGSDLELNGAGRNHYTNALFNNAGDHKAAVAEMVADCEEELKDAE